MTTIAAHDSSRPHTVPLWGLFLALLALTAAEVVLFEVWSHSNLEGTPFMPKYAMVLLLLTFTFPKAAIVMIYFMHLKFEKQLVVLLAIAPFATACLAVIPSLTDAKTLKAHNETYNIVNGLGDRPHVIDETGGEGDSARHVVPAASIGASAAPSPETSSPAKTPASGYGN